VKFQFREKEKEGERIENPACYTLKINSKILGIYLSP